MIIKMKMNVNNENQPVNRLLDDGVFGIRNQINYAKRQL